MSDSQRPRVGTILWTDLTVEDAEGLRDFYSEVAAWRAEPVDMGEYSDFNMLPPEGDEPVAGICHARGSNAALPPAWLVYITVADVEASAQRCRALGGEVVAGSRGMGSHGRLAVIRDPAGAVCALFEPA